MAFAQAAIMRSSLFPQPDLCIEGLPCRTYTDTACLASLLLLVDEQRRIEQQHGEQSARPIDAYYPDSLLDVMDKKLIHHNHNAKVTEILVQAGIKVLILIPSPGSVFANLYCSGVKEDVKVAKYIDVYRDWLGVLLSCERASTSLVLQAEQAAADPLNIAKALSRLGLLGDTLADEEVMDCFDYAIEMTPSISEEKYGQGYNPFSSNASSSDHEEIGERFLLRYNGGAELIRDYLDVSSALGLTNREADPQPA